MGTNSAKAPARDPRRAKQYGDFGEALVMHLLTGYRNMKVAVVDHAGADLIAVDLDHSLREAGRYAISVKSRNLSLKEGRLESRLYAVSGEHIALLKDFAESFGLDPVMAFVMTLPPLPPGHPELVKAQAKRRDGRSYLWPRTEPVTAVFMFKVGDAEEALRAPDFSTPRWLSSDHKGGFNFKFEESYFDRILEDPRIDFAELTINSLSSGALWGDE